MDEQVSSWRGQGFTLFVFTGIVFLCAIFFVLGMLVGRSQSLKAAANGPETKKASTSAAKPDSTLNFSDELQDNKLPPLVVDPPPAADAPPDETATAESPAQAGDPPSPPPPPPPPPPAASVVNIQVAALAQSSQASKLVADLKKLGFAGAFILPPASGGRDPYYRVQLGPYTDAADAESTKKKLEAAGYQPMLKK